MIQDIAIWCNVIQYYDITWHNFHDPEVMFVRWGSALFFANVSPWMCSTSPRARQALFVHPLLRERYIYIYTYTQVYMFRFRKMGVPQIIHFNGIFRYIYKPSVFGYHILGNIPTYIYIYTHTYTYIHLHTYTYIYIYTYIHTYIHI